ncbi:hypothetical protein A3C37_04855 [Candidatus Peribacteria bacterium RIFCSPHIGHO2_02_FULL_53_20]|nr:MAG: hypothetical protein A3C37_04855 [Candidatus Peribacteria bacterium RIFCSPHIGHO2_02_FULL_53_20]OGJ68259.1 MAG: hypothetical protein A3B61_03820 [Candidatus Peribacteria bacterium RIFCSPLOWO2_01_FULL_53_10]OGJ73224.1 MAG: hypothetical protein A3G69_05060 [Candidatus Peribacteria bacterium RIFCSPLOWO2_12_FULL_53_10]
MRSLLFLIALIFLPAFLIACAPVAPSNTGSAASSTSPSSASSAASDVRVSEPQPAVVVKSPLTVQGEARGTWYFEGSFPVRLVDDHGEQIGIGIAQAEGEWMTTDFVPFTVVVAFVTDAETGELVLEKDNPSGLAEHAAEVRIPVRFAP